MEPTPLVTTKPWVKVALDIEKKGCKLDQPIVSVGFAVGSGSKLLEKTRISLDVGECKEWQGDKEFQRCKAEFWDKHPGLEELFKKEALPVKDGLCKIATYVDSLYERYNIESWLSDNPVFDLGHLDHHLHGIREYPIRHSPTGAYTCVEDPTEQLKGFENPFGIQADMQRFWQVPGRAQHLPDDDAEAIWWMSVRIEYQRSFERDCC